MRKLLSANFSRLWKSIFFWGAMVATAIGSMTFCFLDYHKSLDNLAAILSVESSLFNFLPIIAFACAAFINQELVTEFDSNTIRNKLIVGHTRFEVYFTNFITYVLSSVLLLCVMLVISVITGYLCFGHFALDAPQLMILLLSCALIVMIYAAICMTVGMNIDSKYISVISNMILLGLQFLAAYLQSTLAEADMHINGIGRNVAEFVFDLLPTGQAIQMIEMNFERYIRWPWLSIGVLIVVTVIGYIPFRKRDIR
uniref:hypothetical protein n=1 Tax=Agathobacter sp. TaxID=2021311 RepID=UPI0040573543